MVRPSTSSSPPNGSRCDLSFSPRWRRSPRRRSRLPSILLPWRLVVLASDLALALDPVLLSQRAGLVPDDWQERVLRSTSPRLLLNACRQSGKSSTVATLAVHTAVFDSGALILL